jgi:hypothetical protein
MSKNDYSDKLKELRPFISFDFDLRKKLKPSEKAKITKYYKRLETAKGQAYRVYRTKNKKTLKILNKISSLNLPGFKVAIIPNPDPENRYSVKIKNGSPIFYNRSGEKIYIEFNKTNLIENPEKEINAALSKANGNTFAIACGEFEYFIRYASKDNVKTQILKFINEYDDKNSNHYFGRWLNGIYSIKIKNQTKMDAEMIKASIYRAATKNKRKKLLKMAGKNEKKNRNG